MLIQRSVECSFPAVPSSYAEHLGNSPSIHGWTLIIPSGWAMPFFTSLIYTGTRVGGQRERQTQAFEGGCAYFPRDYPSTDSYTIHAEEQEEEARSRWERKPPAKRTNFEKLGTRSPFIADWEVVLGLREPPSSSLEPELISAQREDEPSVAADPVAVEVKPQDSVRPWLLRGPDVPAMLQNLSSMLNPTAGLLDHINKARIRRGQDFLHDVRADELWKSALVVVRIIPCGRGNPEDLAVIYGVDDEEARKWYGAESLRKQGAAALLHDGDDETELSKMVPSPGTIIGYVTTGHYSLSRGTGHAIGSIPLSRLFELRQQAERLRVGSSLLVKIRDRGDNICRAARLEVVP